MLKANRVLTSVTLILAVFISATASWPDYTWTRATPHAAFPEAYNFPMLNIHDRLWTLHSEGNWYSDDGEVWIKAELPALGLRTGYQQYLYFNDAIYGLGAMEGNYLDLHVSSRLARTSKDFKRWDIIAEKSELPPRVFYGAVVFAGKMWLLGGFDGTNYYNDVWNSTDGVAWRRVTDRSPWGVRSNPSIVVFHDELWLFGGGIIDGQSFNDVWHSPDGIKWTLATDKMASQPVFGYSPIVYDGKIWLVGANRNGTFRSAMLVSSDGVNWTEQQAPWSPRGGTATAVFRGRLYMTGGKYSVEENGKPRFIYSNDVWWMSPP